jgi:hypothetical protein
MRWTPTLEFKKDPVDVIDFILNFTPLLQGDTINTAVVAGENITIDSSSISGNKVTAFVSGGSDGGVGKVTTTIVTNNSTPRTFKRMFKVLIQDNLNGSNSKQCRF